MGSSASGLILLHAVPRFLAKQVGWSVSRTLGYETTFSWLDQPAFEGCVRTELIWEGNAAAGAALASVLAGWTGIYFEVTQESSTGVPAARWLYVPQYGIKHMNTDEAGNYLVGEDALRAALARAGTNSLDLHREMQNLLANPWEEQLEPLRTAAADSNVVWLFRAG